MPIFVFMCRSVVFIISKKTMGRHTVWVKDKQGVLRTEKDRMERWKQHFNEILDREVDGAWMK